MGESDGSSTTDVDRGQVNAAAAEVYSAFFVPALFGQFPNRVLEHGGVRRGDRVLDIGCGTGIVAIAARRAVGAAGRVVGVDPNDAMLAVARRAEPAIEWRLGAAERLPFENRSFDRTISPFAAMFFTEPVTALSELARVTVPNGTVTVVTWAGLARTPGYAAMVALVEDQIGRSAADALRAPFALGHRDDVAALLAPIGHAVRIDELPGVARFGSIAEWVRTELRGWTLADLVDDAGEAALAARAERELASFVSPDGSVAFPAPALVGTVTIGRPTGLVVRT